MIDHYPSSIAQHRFIQHNEHLNQYRFRFPNNELATKVEAIFDAQFTVDKVMVELELFEQDYNYSFERMLGWAWFLKLQQVGGGTNENLKIMLRFQEPGSSVCLL